MDLVSIQPVFNLYNHDWPIFTSHPQLPGAKFTDDATVGESIVCQGSIVSGGHVERSIVSPGAYVDEHAVVSDSILMNDVVVGPGAIVRRAIVDKAVRVPAGCQIGVDLDQDRSRGFTVSEGNVVVIQKGRVLG